MACDGYHLEKQQFTLTGVREVSVGREKIKRSKSYYEMVKLKGKLLKEGKYKDMRIEN